MHKIKDFWYRIARLSWWKKIVLTTIGFVVIFGGWKLITPSTKAAPTYQTENAQIGTIVVSVSASGNVAGDNARSVTTFSTGVVKKVLVKNGQSVKAGQFLVELDLDQESKQLYDQALSNYQAAKNNVTAAQTAMLTLQAEMFSRWDDFKVLSESETYKDSASDNRNLAEFKVSQNSWLAAEQKYQQQQAVIKQAQTVLNSAALALRDASPTIVAPITGTVSGLSLQVGSVLAPTSGTSSNASSSVTSSKTIAAITTQAEPTIAVALTETDVPKVKVGDEAVVTIDALSDATFTGKIVSIDTIGSVNSGVTSYAAVIVLDSGADQLFANMSASAVIVLDRKADALLVPISAIMTTNGVSTVRVMKNGQPETVPVETGLQSDTQVEISSGLNEGDLVVTGTSKAVNSSTNNTTRSVFSGFSGPGGGGGQLRTR